MTEEMLWALLAIIDAKIAEQAALYSSDSGLNETLHVTQLINKFKSDFLNVEPSSLDDPPR